MNTTLNTHPLTRVVAAVAATSVLGLAPLAVAATPAPAGGAAPTLRSGGDDDPPGDDEDSDDGPPPPPPGPMTTWIDCGIGREMVEFRPVVGRFFFQQLADDVEDVDPRLTT